MSCLKKPRRFVVTDLTLDYPFSAGVYQNSRPSHFAVLDYPGSICAGQLVVMALLNGSLWIKDEPHCQSAVSILGTDTDSGDWNSRSGDTARKLQPKVFQVEKGVAH